ncbi:MAG: metalloprotease [Acidimicrobiales bacterium]
MIRFELFGFPVSVHLSFGFLVLFLAYGSASTIAGIVGFGAVVFLSILVHELGHAFAARSQGVVVPPAISLEGLGGLTRYRLREVPSRAQSIMISAAGPMAGVAMGVVVLAVDRAGVFSDTGLGNYLVTVALFTTFGWSVFNLVPIAPLDGGHILTELLPGTPLVRRRRAAVVSIVVGIAAAVGLYLLFESVFAPIVIGFLVMQNIAVLQSPRTPSPAPAPPQAGGTPPPKGPFDP